MDNLKKREKFKKLTAPFRSRRPGDQLEASARSSSTDPPSAKVSTAALPCGLKTWYEPSGDKHFLDVVFIHGLTGDRDRTWTSPGASEPWPKTVLPQHFGGARILTFGYDAYLVQKKGSVSNNRLSDHSRDLLIDLVSHRQGIRKDKKPLPLIFITHSMGGLICKDTLLSSRHSSDPGFQTVFHATIGIVFMGTPHTGSWLARWAKIPTAALGIVQSTNTCLLDVLETRNEIISRIQDDFMDMIRATANTKHEVRLFCFYKALPMPYARYVVEQDSAVLPGYNRSSLQADHRNMVRFPNTDEEDAGRTLFIGVLKGWISALDCFEKFDSLSEGKIQELRSRCLSSVAFPEMNARKADINNPLSKACQWVFGDKR